MLPCERRAGKEADPVPPRGGSGITLAPLLRNVRSGRPS
jgi:hypothetical protein